MRKLVDLLTLDRLDSLIRRAATGSPEELAEKLGISRSWLFELIAFLKEEMYAPIVYNKNRCSYIYSYPPKFYLGFERDRLNTSENLYYHVGGDEKTKKNNKIKIEIEVDDFEEILDDDIDFKDLYV